MTLQTTICFIACHGGPADHFAAYAKTLKQNGYDVRIYAVGDAAIKTFKQCNVDVNTSYSLQRPQEVDELSKEIAKTFSVVVTDAGDLFDITLQKSLAEHAPNVRRWAYYDN